MVKFLMYRVVGKKLDFGNHAWFQPDLFKVKSFTIYIYYDLLSYDDIDSETDRLEVNIRCYESDVTRNNFFIQM